MQHAMPAIGPEFWPWADEVSAAVLRGEELYYFGLPKSEQETPDDPAAKLGFTLDCFDKEGDLVAEHELAGLTAERLQEILSDPDIDRVMCLTHSVTGDTLAAVDGRELEVDEDAFDYYVSAWADPGFRTPRGYFPPPRILPAFPGAEKHWPG
jgi:hypothetical protein